MITDEVAKYYQATRQTELRPELQFALQNVSAPDVAVDCGCGAGSNIAHLRAAGFTVHAFDTEASGSSQKFLNTLSSQLPPWLR